MEDQLAAYRAKKAREKESLQSSSTFGFVSGVFSRNKTGITSDHTDSTQTASAPTGPVTISENGDIISESQPWITTTTILKIILWFALWKVFVELGFGAVYFIVTLSVILYRNTRTGPKRDGKLSAYSVFNPNCERIDGTFTAEQFEKELRHGAGAVH